MDIYALIAAFVGGAFGALIGARPAFILTGILALVTTAAFAANKRKTLKNLSDILTPLYGINDYPVVIVQ